MISLFAINIGIVNVIILHNFIYFPDLLSETYLTYFYVIHWYTIIYFHYVIIFSCFESIATFYTLVDIHVSTVQKNSLTNWFFVLGMVLRMLKLILSGDLLLNCIHLLGVAYMAASKCRGNSTGRQRVKVSLLTLASKFIWSWFLEMLPYILTVACFACFRNVSIFLKRFLWSDLLCKL